MTTPAFPYLLLPSLWSSRNRARRRERGDGARASFFGIIGLAVGGAILGGALSLTLLLAPYSGFGGYLLRPGLSWLFLPFISFLPVRGILTPPPTFFLSCDPRPPLPP